MCTTHSIDHTNKGICDNFIPSALEMVHQTNDRIQMQMYSQHVMQSMDSRIWFDTRIQTFTSAKAKESLNLKRKGMERGETAVLGFKQEEV